MDKGTGKALCFPNYTLADAFADAFTIQIFSREIMLSLDALTDAFPRSAEMEKFLPKLKFYGNTSDSLRGMEMHQ